MILYNTPKYQSGKKIIPLSDMSVSNGKFDYYTPTHQNGKTLSIPGGVIGLDAVDRSGFGAIGGSAKGIMSSGEKNQVEFSPNLRAAADESTGYNYGEVPKNTVWGTDSQGYESSYRTTPAPSTNFSSKWSSSPRKAIDYSGGWSGNREQDYPYKDREQDWCDKDWDENDPNAEYEHRTRCGNKGNIKKFKTKTKIKFRNPFKKKDNVFNSGGGNSGGSSGGSFTGGSSGGGNSGGSSTPSFTGSSFDGMSLGSSGGGKSGGGGGKGFLGGLFGGGGGGGTPSFSDGGTILYKKASKTQSDSIT